MDRLQKKSQGRRNIQQLEFMADYLTQHPEVATGKFTTLNVKDKLQGSWEELSANLNGMKHSNHKNVKSWKKVSLLLLVKYYYIYLYKRTFFIVIFKRRHTKILFGL